MKLLTLPRVLAALLLLALFGHSARAATQMPPGEVCFSATTGINGMVGALGTITGGTGGTAGTYGGVALTGGSGTNATANITVAGGAVTAVAILNPGVGYVVGDVLSAVSGNIGGVTGFSVPVNSVSINSAVAGGTVAFYIPGTLTFKQTWQDAGQTMLNTNPITLDQNGCAIIYGNGTYRQILQDALGNTVWDQLTTSTSGTGPTWGGTSAGTPNAQTITANFSGADGQVVGFIAGFTNSSAATLTINGGSPIGFVEDTSQGPVPLVGGEIVAGNAVQGTYTLASNTIHIPAPPGISVPIGVELTYYGGTVPNNFILEYGQCVSQTTYSVLFAVLGTQYGSCAAGQFGLPDTRGRVTAGLDNMGGTPANRLNGGTMTPDGNTLGAIGGFQASVIVTGNLPPYTPSGTIGTSLLGLPSASLDLVQTGALTTSSLPGGVGFSIVTGSAVVAFGTPTASSTFTGTAQGGTSTPLPVVQPTILANKMMRYQ